MLRELYYRGDEISVVAHHYVQRQDGSWTSLSNDKFIKIVNIDESCCKAEEVN